MLCKVMSIVMAIRSRRFAAEILVETDEDFYDQSANITKHVSPGISQLPPRCLLFSKGDLCALVTWAMMGFLRLSWRNSQQ